MTLLKDVLQCVEGVRSYSGRGMNGRICLGITTDNPIKTVLEITKNMLDQINSIDVDIESDIERHEGQLSEVYELIGDLQECQTDSMGRSQIVYFPEIPWDLEYANESDD